MTQQLKNFLYPPLLALILSGGVIFIYIMFFNQNIAKEATNSAPLSVVKTVNPRFELGLFEEEDFKRLKYYGD